jgi:hypothetical protein
MTSENPQKTIENLEKQIAQLTAELSLARKKSESLWCTVFDSFIEDGNDESTADHFANKFSVIILDWAKTQRDRLSRTVASTGVMAPYSQCLNDLVVSITAPGKEPEKLGDVPVPLKEDILDLPDIRQPTVEDVPKASEQLSDDAKVGPPKMKRVNVPKGTPGAITLSLA